MNRDSPSGGHSGEEPNRFLGFPVRPGGRAADGEESQHVMGMPAGWLESADFGAFRSLSRPVQWCRQWARRRLDSRRGDR
ncbi:MAG TPA: hypothetical protein VHN16_07235 [Streptosporangiaceae bacterium]|nr:hypothetical protein [Streptosporangiaceae bacterium]